MWALFSFKIKYLYFFAGQGRKSARRGKKARKFSDRGFSNVSLAGGDCEQIEAQKIILAGPVDFLVRQIFFLGFLSCNFNGLNSTLPRTAPQVLTRRGSLFPCGAGHASLVSQRQALEMEKLERDAKVQQLPSKNIWCVTCEVPLAFDQMLVFFSIAADDSKQVEQKCPAGFFPVPPEY